MSIAEIVDCILRNHPSDCVFAPGARERIIEAGLAVTRRPHNIRPSIYDFDGAIIDALEAAFKAEEIYCPHEGIDRRAEFGWPHPTTTGWLDWGKHREEMV